VAVSLRMCVFSTWRASWKSKPPPPYNPLVSRNVKFAYRTFLVIFISRILEECYGLRSIKVKLIVARGKDEESRLKSTALWTTHSLFNEGVAYYMEWLLRMKREPFRDILCPSKKLLENALSSRRKK